MNAKELLEKYYFHDSQLVEIREYPKENEIELDICVCLFMQDNYQPEDPENGVIRFKIKTMDYINPFLDITNTDDYEILDSDMKNGYLHFYCTNYADERDAKELYIKTNEIEEELLYYGFPPENDN